MIIKGYWGKREENERTVIVSCGHVFTYKGREINRPRGRSDYLLLYIYHGSAKFYFFGREHICNSGDFVLYAPHEPQHHIYESNLSGEFYYVHFTSEDEDFLSLLGMESSKPYSAMPSSSVSDVFEEILSELQQKNPGYKDMCTSLAQNLFIKVSRQISKNSNTFHANDIGSVIQHIQQFYKDNNSLEEYANMCGLSKYHFLREFQKAAHMPPVKYRNKIRLEHAKELLTNTSLDIKIIAEKLGYSSAGYFFEVFKSSEGVSPREYRKKTKKLIFEEENK
ncbi:MAG: helix-turn-helix transcriptional regulator [Clostridia bacterium]|nr:helix-turn-helix transcriptional regulator [Clostridia bacterium]